jgi:hypothetical protein
MMALRQAGFFRELAHGGKKGPSLKECRRVAGQPDEAIIARYLESAAILSTSFTMLDDYLNPAKKAVVGLWILTDGTWCWPSDLTYYVREYHVELPMDFVSHMRQLSWQPPELTRDDLIRISKEERKAGFTKSWTF